MEKKFYQGKIIKKKELKDFAKYHNFIKKYLINKYAKNVELLVDLGSGAGGDLFKWYDANIKSVIGIEPSKESIIEANRRLKDFQGKFDDFPIVLFVNGVGDKPIKNGKAGLTKEDKEILKDLFKNKKANVITSQFAIHYFFDSKIQIKNTIENIKDLLLPGGYLIITTFNGRKLVDKTIKNDKGEIIAKINIKDTKPTVIDGYKIVIGKVSVYFSEFRGLANELEENIVDLDELIKLFKNNGLQLIERKSFEEMYEKSNISISDKDKEISFLYDYLVFRKV